MTPQTSKRTEGAKTVWGVTVLHYGAAEAVGERSQVRAIVRARSRAAAGRALAAAGLYSDADSATRHLAGYGCPTGNERELEVCADEGKVFVARTTDSRDYTPWPPSSSRVSS